MTWLRFPRILGIVVCLYLVGMSVVFGNLSTQSYRFVHGAAATEGTVVALQPQATAGSSRTPAGRAGKPVPMAPRVRYVVNGTPYEYVAAHGRYRQPLQVGDRVTVLYDPRDPAQARLQGEGRVLVPLITSGFVTSAVLVGVVLFLTRNAGRAGRPAGAPTGSAGRRADPPSGPEGSPPGGSVARSPRRPADRPDDRPTDRPETPEAAASHT